MVFQTYPHNLFGNNIFYLKAFMNSFLSEWRDSLGRQVYGFINQRYYRWN